MSYLYGASVQGIQKFIFETNELKDIVGASEIVEQICTENYKKYLGNKLKPDNKDGTIELIMAAAGKIKLLADKKEDLKDLVLKFPKAVQEGAPGITISQAVVEVKGEIDSDEYFKLEKNLKIQRNKPQPPFFITALGIERSRKTGKPAYDIVEKEKAGKSAYDKKEIKFRDLASYKKQDRSHKMCKDKDKVEKLNTKTAFGRLAEKICPKNGSKGLFPVDLSKITNSEKSNWLAVIHADGNSLGKFISSYTESIKDFSKNLDQATRNAAQAAFDNVILSDFNTNIQENFPIRPIVLGGDDLTVICRADLALEFTKTFLSKFENETEDKIGQKLTACAGIAFVKEKYPFHYAIDLAEELCGFAKQRSKDINSNEVPASIAFHKVLSSFIGNYKEIRERELTAGDVGFDYGPYAIKENDKMAQIKDLTDVIDILKKKDIPKGGIRKWLEELKSSRENANLLMMRIKQILSEKQKDSEAIDKLKWIEKTNNQEKTILYDVLTIISLGSDDDES